MATGEEPGAATAALLLAAGESTRMGRSKQLLEWEGRPLIEYQIGELLAAGVDEVVAVLGHRAEEIRPLAERAGAQLQMLVVDEGFGTQDSQGRERLVEAVNAIAADFEKIIVITHIDELKDLFATRIEVVKGAEGSRVTITP